MVAVPPAFAFTGDHTHTQHPKELQKEEKKQNYSVLSEMPLFNNVIVSCETIIKK